MLIFFNTDSIERYLCLVEGCGISLFHENTFDNHVAYMPEFHIGEVFACSYGLLVVPSKNVTACESNEDKYIYALTHPVKQVSRLWTKTPTRGITNHRSAMIHHHVIYYCKHYNSFNSNSLYFFRCRIC